MRLFPNLVISCEHGGNDIPPAYENLFHGHEQLLNSHWGWDPGAADLAQGIANHFKTPLYICKITRLLIEVNRSLSHDQLFSKISKELPELERERLIQEIYKPYREALGQHIASLKGPVLHISVHTFTPCWEGKERNVDLGILFDPSSLLESDFSNTFHSIVSQYISDFVISFNEPYRGVDDGFTTTLRGEFPHDWYAGIELEVNQKYWESMEWKRIQKAIIEGVNACIIQDH